MSAADSVRPGFRRLAAVTAALIYLLIVVGGIVRVTGSGLGCPDWPLCYGQVLPPPEIEAIIEFSHRFVAGVGGLFILATAFFAWRDYRRQRWISVPALAVIVLLAIQVPLGAVVVLTELEPLSVAVHLGMALLIFACALAVVVAAYRPAGLPGDTLPPHFLRLLGAGIAVLFLLVTTGAIVVGEGASFSCPDWPLCNGSLFPAADAPLPVILHLLHRYTVIIAGLVLALAIVHAVYARRGMPGLYRWALLLGVLFVGQAGIGAAKIWTHLATFWRVLHLATAAGVWATLIVMAVLGYFRQRAAAAQRA